MPYNNLFPVGYQPAGNYFQQPPMQYPYSVPQMQPTQMPGANQQTQQPAPQMAQPPVQNSAPFNVRSEQEARDWPIAPGNSLTFINEAEGYVYTKTSLNQFDRPQFVKYKLVREDVQQPVDVPRGVANTPVPDYALKSDVEAVKGEIMSEIEEFRARLDGLAVKKPAARGKKEDDGDA